MNKITLTGRLTKETEVTYSQKGDEALCIAHFSLAVKRKGDTENADFFKCTAFGKSAEIIEKTFKKGMKVIVSGTVKTGSYKKVIGTEEVTFPTFEVIVEDWEYAESKKDNSTQVAQTAPQVVQAAPQVVQTAPQVVQTVPQVAQTAPPVVQAAPQVAPTPVVATPKPHVESAPQESQMAPTPSEEENLKAQLAAMQAQLAAMQKEETRVNIPEQNYETFTKEIVGFV